MTETRMHKDHAGTDVVEQPQASASSGNSLDQPRAHYDSAANRTQEPFPLPLVSVIIPAYNAEKSIARTLDSVLSQTYRNLEVLVINDGSRDKTVEIAESYVWKDPRVRVLNQPNLGLSAARNHGIRFAKGQYVAPIDADDIWHKEKIQAQVECFQRSNTSVGLVYSWSMIIDENGNPLTGIAYKYRGNVLAELIYSNFVGNGSCPLVRQSCFEEIGVFDVHLRACEDRDMYLRIAEQYEFQVVPRYHVGYTKALSSMSANFKNQDKFITTVMDNFEKRHPHIPKTLFRLSRSRTCFYLASLCNEHGRYLDSVKYLLRCLALDPVRVLSSEYNLSVLKLLVRCTTKPIVSLMWRDQLVWGKLHRRLLTLVGSGPAAQYRLGGGDSVRRRPRLYDRIHDKRMSRLKGIMESNRSWKQKS